MNLKYNMNEYMICRICVFALQISTQFIQITLKYVYMYIYFAPDETLGADRFECLDGITNVTNRGSVSAITHYRANYK